MSEEKIEDPGEECFGQILVTLKADMIEWYMEAFESGDKKFPAHYCFERPKALSVLLAHEIVFLNTNWMEKTWPEKAKKTVALCVNCNDVFAWACADAERLEYTEIENLYRMWLKDPQWGSAVWCIIKRNQMPQPPVEKRIRADGIWDLDALNLGKNTQDEEVQALFRSLREGKHFEVE